MLRQLDFRFLLNTTVEVIVIVVLILSLSLLFDLNPIAGPAPWVFLITTTCDR